MLKNNRFIVCVFLVLSISALPSLSCKATKSAGDLAASSTASPYIGVTPLTVYFSCDGSNGTSPYTYSWDFGDGNSSTDQNPSNTYNYTGKYYPTCTVTDDKGNSASTTLKIGVGDTNTVEAIAIADPTSGKASLSVSFDCAVAGGTSPYTFSWNFGDGNTSTDQSTSDTYSSSGTYYASCEADDYYGYYDIDTVTISVE